MGEMLSLGARYCVRQHAHAFFWLWGLFIVLLAVAYALQRRRMTAGVIAYLFLALSTGALGFSVFYGCYRWAPSSMGFSTPGESTANIDTFMCLGEGAVSTAAMWTVVVVFCSAAIAGFALARSHGKSVAKRVLFSILRVISILAAIAAGLLWFFGFSWCLSRRLF
jgi:hypothetical protein